MISRKLKFAVATIAGFAVGGSVAQAETFVQIGTGGQTGVYYALGGAICRLVNRDSKKNHIKCTYTTGSSITNLNGIRVGDIDFGVAQSDWQYHAYVGDTPKVFPKGANKDLRSVFGAHNESVTIMARKDAHIKTLADLKGKRVNIGNPGSGTRATMQTIMDAEGWTNDSFKLTTELKSADMAKALCDNKIDAFMFVVGNPNGALTEAATTCDTNLVQVVGPAIDKLVSAHSYYVPVTIPGGLYKGSDKPTKSFGVVATFVSSAKTPDDVIYAITKAVFEHFKQFKRMHPVFEHLKKADMINPKKAGLTAPLHPGAIRYYKEAGLMK